MDEFQRKLMDATGWNEYLASFAEPGRTILAIDTYSYSVDENTTPVATVLSTTIPLSRDLVMEGDADFICCYFSGFGRKTGSLSDLIINPSILVQIKDQASGKRFYNEPAPMGIICGDSGFPFLLTSPRRIRPRTTLTVDFTTLSQDWTGVYFTMHGGRIWYAS